MLVLTLIVWEALGLPEVENPIPDRIGLSFSIDLAGALGVIGGILSVIAWPRRREQFISVGTVVGFCLGIGIYALSFLTQLLFGP